MKETEKMTRSQILRLLFVAAVWGGSHVFVRTTVPEIGPALTAFGRVFIAAITLLLFHYFSKTSFQYRGNGKRFFIVGFLNTALPFTLFSFASVHLPSAYLVILNSTVPVFSAIFASVFLKDSFGLKKVMSLFLAMTGVVLLKEFGSIEHITPEVILSMAMGLGAAASYAICGIVIKKMGYGNSPTSLTTGSSLASLLFLLPLAVKSAFALPPVTFSHHSMAAVAFSLSMLGIFGTGIAYVTYYKLLEEIGPFKASLSTFLIPIFGLVWGVVFLQEPLTLGMIGGAVLVLLSTFLFVRRK